VSFNNVYLHDLGILEPKRVELEWETPKVWRFQNLQSNQFVIKGNRRNNFGGNTIVMQKEITMHKESIKSNYDMSRTKSLIGLGTFSYD
jgi:hypothetical protein